MSSFCSRTRRTGQVLKRRQEGAGKSETTDVNQKLHKMLTSVALCFNLSPPQLSWDSEENDRECMHIHCLKKVPFLLEWAEKEVTSSHASPDLPSYAKPPPTTNSRVQCHYATGEEKVGHIPTAQLCENSTAQTEAPTSPPIGYLISRLNLLSLSLKEMTSSPCYASR